MKSAIAECALLVMAAVWAEPAIARSYLPLQRSKSPRLKVGGSAERAGFGV